MAKVNSNYGGNVRSVNVVSSEFSQANSEVIVEAVGVRGGSTNERFRCLVSDDGNVQDLSAIQELAAASLDLGPSWLRARWFRSLTASAPG